MTCTLETETVPASIAPEGSQNRGYRVSAILVGVAAFVLAISTLVGVVAVKMNTASFDRKVYKRVSFWIKSAESTLKNGTFLTLVDDQGKIIPIEEQHCADDLGQALIVDIVTYITKVPMSLWKLAQVNLVINTIGLMMLSLAFLYCRLVVSAILILLAGAWVGIPYFPYSPDNWGVYLGCYCLALVLPVFLVHRTGTSLFSRWFDVVFFLLGWLCLAATFLLRQPIGTIGILISIILSVCLALRERPRKIAWALRYVVVLSVLIGIFFIPKGLLGLRNYLFNLPSSSQTSSHGFSHTLYLGLGTEANPWGITWNDACADTAARNVAPNIRYCSEQYFSTVRSLYLKLLWNHPWEVLEIYAKKFGRILSLRSEWLPGTLSFYLVFIPVFTVILTFFLRSSPQFRLRLLQISVLFCFSLVFLLQGVLGYPSVQYLAPVFWGILVNTIVLLCTPLP